MTLTPERNKSHSSNGSNNTNGKPPDLWDTQVNVHRKCSQRSTARSQGKPDSVLSTDSDIRFTRRKLGDGQKCGCALIAGFLVFLLFASAAVYIAYIYYKSDGMPERIFRGKLRIVDGDTYTPELADQSSLRFQQKAKFYQDGIDEIINQSDLKVGFERSEVLALDGVEDKTDLNVHFNMHFDPYQALVSSADLLSVFIEQIGMNSSKHFSNLTFDPTSLDINEVKELMAYEPATSSASLGGEGTATDVPPAMEKTPRRCEPVRISYCSAVGYNVTTYPNLLGHKNLDEATVDLIAFREIVDSECFRQAYDFVCRMLQPPCLYRDSPEPAAGTICRQYCTEFQKECGNRIPNRYKAFFDCDHFPESMGSQSCRARPNCVEDLEARALSNRLCDGIADCPDLSDETKCSYCPLDSLYCGRGRACVPRVARCDGKLDCPDGSDEKDCLSVAPLISELNEPKPLTPQQTRFHTEGFAIFSEKGDSGKLCTERLEDKSIQHTVAESLCKALGYEKVTLSETRNDTEPNTRYVRVIDPKASEISFERTSCQQKKALYVACSNLECGVQSILAPNSVMSLSKMAAPGDWPWHVSLHRDETHVCDGTLVSENWVLTTNSCFQGQSKATWIAVFGNIRLSSSSPWMQRRRIIGMVKSPVEGSTAALVRLESPIVYSDFIRPICLPDDVTSNRVHAVKVNQEKLSRTKKEERSEEELNENRDIFIGPEASSWFESDEFGEVSRRARSIIEEHIHPMMEHGKSVNESVELAPEPTDTQWATCNTLGWSRQREHLQRVQLKMSNMASCENISIATVNSICTEAAFHKQDCTEEEFAGAPVMCILPDSHRWALIGIASWRIACAPTGIERPRMYDKIAPNSAWIRHTINAT